MKIDVASMKVRTLLGNEALLELERKLRKTKVQILDPS